MLRTFSEVGGRFKKVTFALTQLHKMHNDGKTDLLIENRKQSNFGSLILRNINTEN